MSDLSGTCKHGTSRAKPCGECMKENMAEVAVAADNALRNSVEIISEERYTIKQAVEMIMKHEELYILRDRDRSEIVHPAYLDFTTRDEVLELLTPQ